MVNPADASKMMGQVKAFQQILESQTVKVETDGITVEMNLSLKVVAVELDPDKVDTSNMVKFEIQLKNAFNNALTEAQNVAAQVIREEVGKNPDLLNFGQ